MSTFGTRASAKRVIPLRIVRSERSPSRKSNNDIGDWQRLGDVANKLVRKLELRR